MTSLIYSTEKILDVAKHELDWDCPHTLKNAIAAALREVVKQAAFEDFSNRLMMAQDVLDAADKLESH